MSSIKKRRIGSIKSELIKKSREAALAAIQLFNNPQITFKSELFIVTMVIAWTYLIHAYFRQKMIDYRYYEQHGMRKFYDKTKNNAFKHWELERCINDRKSPLDKNTANNLRFLIGLRHEIEHQMTMRIDNTVSAKFQACCINYNFYLKKLFGKEFGLDKHLSFSLQLSGISKEQKELLAGNKDLPENIKAYIDNFESNLSDKEFEHPKYSYRVLFVQKTANRKGQADEVIEFVKANTRLAKDVNITYASIKEVERPKYLPSQIVELMWDEGYDKFSIYYHTKLWQKKDGKNPAKGYGVYVAGRSEEHTSELQSR